MKVTQLLTVFGWEIGETSFTPMPRYHGTKTMAAAHLRMPDGTAMELDREAIMKMSLSVEDKRPTKTFGHEGRRNPNARRHQHCRIRRYC